MRRDPHLGLAREIVALAVGVCQLIYWVCMIVGLAINYHLPGRGFGSQLQQPV